MGVTELTQKEKVNTQGGIFWWFRPMWAGRGIFHINHHIMSSDSDQQILA